jgi:hypothetical protein
MGRDREERFLFIFIFPKTEAETEGDMGEIQIGINRWGEIEETQRGRHMAYMSKRVRFKAEGKRQRGRLRGKKGQRKAQSVEEREGKTEKETLNWQEKRHSGRERRRVGERGRGGYIAG